MVKNIASLDRKIERTWPRRRLTIVGGDFNRVAEKRSKRNGADVLSTGLERDPDCWYRMFSRAHRDRTSGGRACGRSPHARPVADRYYDAGHLLAKRTGDGAICREWTYTRKLRARRGDACTDVNSDDLRDRSRLDYIWVGWEHRDGEPVSLRRAEAARLIPAAAADRSCIDAKCASRRYSDHRAFSATVRWTTR